MTMADKPLEIAIDLNTKDAVKSSKQLANEIKRIFEDEGRPSSDKLSQMEVSLKKDYYAVKQLRGELVNLYKSRDAFEHYDKLGEKHAQLTRQVREIRQVIAKGPKEEGGELFDYQGEEVKLEELKAKLKELEAERGEVNTKMTSLEDTHKDIGTTEGRSRIDSGIADTETKLSILTDKINVAVKKYNDLAEAERNAGDEGQRRFSGLRGIIYELGREIAQFVTGGIRNIGPAVTAVANGVRGIVKNFSKAIASAKRFFASMKKGSASTNKSLKKSLMMILRYGLGIRSLYALFNKIRHAVKEGFTNLYKGNEKFKKSVDDLKGSLTTLKNSLASAFQPIVSFAIPYIKKLVDWLSTALEALAKFNAALVGQKYYVKALKQTGDAAKKAKKELSGLDNLNVLQTDDGGGMFQEVPLTEEEQQIDLMQKLRDLVAELESYGAKLGTLIRDALNSIPWDKIKEVAALIAQGLGNFINGLVRVEGLGEAIGKSIAEMLNTWILFKKELLDTINFEDVGKFFGDIAQSFVETFNWEGLGDLLATEFNSIFETLKGFTEEFNGLDLGQGIASTINFITHGIKWDEVHAALAGLAEDLDSIVNGLFQNTDWTAVGRTLSEGISSILDFAIDMIANFDAEAAGEGFIRFLQGIDWMKIAAELGLLLISLVEKALEFLWGAAATLNDSIADFFDEIGWNGIAGFFRGMAENLRTAVKWIKEKFQLYIVKPVKDFFGIHSPSTLFADFGKMLIEGLKKGINDKITSVIDTIRLLKIKIVSKFNDIKDAVVDIFEKLGNALKKPVNAIIDIVEGLVNNLIDGINWFIDKLNTIQLDIENPFTGASYSIGVDLPRLSNVSIPRLAQGAVIPANKQFLAVLGDQKSGTNIEAPLDTIKQALSEVMADEKETIRNQEIVLNLDGREFMRAMVKQNNEYKKTHGGISAMA